MKIIINNCYGGYGLSEMAVREYCKEANISVEGFEQHHFMGFHYNIDRDDELLVSIVEKLGDKANGHAAELVIKEIPKGLEYQISEYDGFESIDYTYLVLTQGELKNGLSNDRLELASKADYLRMG